MAPATERNKTPHRKKNFSVVRVSVRPFVCLSRFVLAGPMAHGLCGILVHKRSQDPLPLLSVIFFFFFNYFRLFPIQIWQFAMGSLEVHEWCGHVQIDNNGTCIRCPGSAEVAVIWPGLVRGQTPDNVLRWPDWGPRGGGHILEPIYLLIFDEMQNSDKFKAAECSESLIKTRLGFTIVPMTFTYLSKWPVN